MNTAAVLPHTQSSNVKTEAHPRACSLKFSLSEFLKMDKVVSNVTAHVHRNEKMSFNVFVCLRVFE